MKALVHLLNYTTTYSDAKIHYYSSGILLHMYSDESYFSLPKAQSRAREHYLLSNRNPDLSKGKPNGAINVLCNILKNVI